MGSLQLPYGPQFSFGLIFTSFFSSVCFDLILNLAIDCNSMDDYHPLSFYLIESL